MQNGVILTVLHDKQQTGGEIMTNTRLLETWITKSGKKKAYLAEKVGLSRAGFRNCCINRAEFTANQIRVLCDELGITKLTDMEAVFFAKCVA